MSMFRAIAIEDEHTTEWGDLYLRTGDFLGFFDTEEEAHDYAQQEFNGVSIRLEEVPYSLVKDIDRIFQREQRLGFFKDHPEVMEKLYMVNDRNEAELIIARA